MKNISRILSSIVLVLLLSFSTRADNIYIMNAPGYNIAGADLITAMQSLGHTVTVNSVSYDTWPNAFTSACENPNSGYHWLCFFGEYDFSAFVPQVMTFIAAGGKVYYNYEVTCCTESSNGAAAMLSGLTGLPITPNIEGYIALGGWTANLGGCIDISGNAYKGLDGVPVANQLQANGIIAGASPDYTVCTNFGYFFTGADIPGNTNSGSITGMGDINAWYDTSEPGAAPVNLELVEYFFPNQNSTCHLATAGCFNPCPYVNVLGPDQTVCTGESTLLDVTTPNVTYLWHDGSTGATFNALQAGTFWVTLDDGLVSCTDTIHITETIVNAVATADVTICQGLSANLSADGGDTYSWSPAGSLSNGNIQSPVAAPLVTTIYTVTATIDGCTDTDVVTVTVVPADVDYSVNTSAAICEVEGTLELTQITGGQGPYTIQLDGIDILANDLIELPAGAYSLEITDDVGCMLTAIIDVADDSYDLFMETELLNPLCDIPGQIEVTSVSNNSGVVTYFLNNVIQTDAIFENLSTNAFDVMVKDANGCQANDLVNLIEQTNVISFTMTSQDPICTSLGEIQVSNIANGLEPYVIEVNNQVIDDGIAESLAQGNYNVKVTDAAGCESLELATLTLQSPPIDLLLNTTDAICETSGRLESVTVSGALWPYVMTIDGEVYTSGVLAIDATEHILIITDANGCTQTELFRVENINITEAIFIATPYITNAPIEVVFTNSSLNADEYQWNFGNDEISSEVNPSFEYLEPGDYVVSLVAIDNVNGCRDSVTTTVYMSPPNSIYVPNTFTPDGDGVNDVFSIYGENISKEDFKFSVFNRWGDPIWIAASPSESWTGGYQFGDYYVPDGIYSYRLQYRFLNSPDIQSSVGHIQIIR